MGAPTTMGCGEVWATRIESAGRPGDRPRPIAFYAEELGSGRRIELDASALARAGPDWFDPGEDALVVGYDVELDLAGLLALGWPLPRRALDLRVEAFNARDGRHPSTAPGRPGALDRYGLDAIRSGALSRRLGRAEGPDPAALGRCRSAVASLGILWRGLGPTLSGPVALGRALLRGRYLAAAAVVGSLGVPVDIEHLVHLGADCRPRPHGRDGLPIGADGRNRSPIKPFGTVTGRNPDPARYLPLGPGRLRGSIRPTAGRALALLDWHAQEVGVAAALAGDPALGDAYRSGDPYLGFGHAAGLVPADATKQSHPEQRKLCKACLLGVLYGMGPASLSLALGRPHAEAGRLIARHRTLYRAFWSWCEAAEAGAAARGRASSAFGWGLPIGPATRPGTIRNFPIQADGAEMLRLAACLAIDRGVAVCGLAHDALLIEGAEDGIAADIEAARRAMDEASAVVLDGPALRVDVRVLCRDGTT